MRVVIVHPGSPTAESGNRTTAERWARLLGDLGHRVRIASRWTGEEGDLLIALHGRKSFDSIVRWREARGAAAPLVLMLTGTDLYRDLDRGPEVREAMAAADRVVTLHGRVFDRLPPSVHEKVRVIRQSAIPSEALPVAGETRSPPPEPGAFEIAVLANLRPIKDPLRAARAAAALPRDSRIRILHAGASLDDELEVRVRDEAERNPRYRWLGPLPYADARRLLARSRALVLTSLDEGGANVVSEAIVDGVPVLTSAIPGSLGLLGDDHPGTFTPGNTRQLTRLLERIETEEAFRRELGERSRRLAPGFTPSVEREALAELLGELAPRR